MNNLISFNSLIGNKVVGLYVVVFPPAGEEDIVDLDISFGLDFVGDGKQIYLVTTSSEDNWSPLLKSARNENAFEWGTFYQRMKSWMNDENFGDLDYEFYEVTTESIFSKMSGASIRSIEYIYAKEATDPFGVRILIGDDYLISFSNTNGNMIETSDFKIGRDLSVFKQFGELEFKKINQ
jgi:hypothetical protein